MNNEQNLMKRLTNELINICLLFGESMDRAWNWKESLYEKTQYRFTNSFTKVFLKLILLTGILSFMLFMDLALIAMCSQLILSDTDKYSADPESYIIVATLIIALLYLIIRMFNGIVFIKVKEFWKDLKLEFTMLYNYKDKELYNFYRDKKVF